MKPEPLTLALPKGRLQEQVQDMLEKRGLSFSFENRKLVAHDPGGLLKVYLVRNSDLPTYVTHGIAGLGICGEDVIYEAGADFFKLHTFDFGGSNICLAGRKGESLESFASKLSVATKFTKFARDYFHAEGIPVQVIKLNGSVELAPVLGLAPFIVDIVETGSTLKANDLEVLQVLKEIKVHLVANPAYYKFHYTQVNRFVDLIRRKDS